MFRRKPEPDVGRPHLSLAELVERKRVIDTEIAQRGEEELENLKHQLLIVAEATGHTLDDLFGAPKKTKERKKRETKPKYRDPDTGETWSGKGKPKKWLQTKLDEGRALDEFALS